MIRKGQITLYIIMGVILLAIIFATIYLLRPGDTEVKQTITLSQEAQTVKRFVDSCLDKTVNGGVLYIASQGGHLTSPEKSLRSDYSQIPYYYDKGENLVISQEELQTNLENYITESLPLCIDGFRTFDYDITIGDITANVTVNPENIGVIIEFPITLQFGERIESLEEFEESYDIRLGLLRNISEDIIKQVEVEPEMIPLSYLLDKQIRNNVQIAAFEKNNETVYIIEDNRSIENIPLMYLFATK